MTSERRPSELAIERLALGELAPDEAARVRDALGDDAQARLDALAKDDAETLARLPPAVVAAEVRRRLAVARPQPQPQPVRWWIPAGAMVAAGLAAWWIARPPRATAPEDGPSIEWPSDPGSDDVVRIKGDATLSIDRVGVQGLEPLREGDLVRAGDRLQLHYRAADRQQGAIVSIDGRGVATLHFPADADAAPVLATGGTVALDHSYELDDAPGFERFFFVTVTPGRTLDVARVLAAAETLAKDPRADERDLDLPAGYEQRATTLRKPTR